MTLHRDLPLTRSPSTRPPTQQLLNLRLTSFLLLITVANNYCFTISDVIFPSFIFKNCPKGVETARGVEALATNPGDLHPSLQPTWWEKRTREDGNDDTKLIFSGFLLPERHYEPLYGRVSAIPIHR